MRMDTFKRLIFLVSLSFMATSGLFAQNRVLIYTHTGEEGFIHKNIKASVEALKKMTKEHQIKADVSDDPADFTRANLARYDALIFSNTNDEAFTSDKQRLALVHYMEAGGRFVGIHAASTSEPDWPWFWSMIGGKFVRHPKFQPFDLKVIDPSHPSVSFLGDIWHWADECYLMNHLNPANRVLLAVDLTTVRDDKLKEYPGDVFGDLFPLAWCRKTQHGRIFYTALGHESEDYSEPKFVRHLWEGIKWVLDDPGDIDFSRASATHIHRINLEN